jgi:hypothetical protein
MSSKSSVLPGPQVSFWPWCPGKGWYTLSVTISQNYPTFLCVNILVGNRSGHFESTTWEVEIEMTLNCSVCHGVTSIPMPLGDLKMESAIVLLALGTASCSLFAVSSWLHNNGFLHPFSECFIYIKYTEFPTPDAQELQSLYRNLWAYM